MRISTPGRRTLDLVATVSMIAASLLLIWTLVTGRSSGTLADSARPADRDGASGVENVEASNFTVRLAPQQTIKVGTPRIAVVEFSDFDCPYCGRHAREIFPRLRADFVDGSRIAYAFFNFPIDGLHPTAVAAAQAAACAGKMAQFWPMHDLLFHDQRARSIETFYQYAEDLRLDKDRFRPCVTNRSADVESDRQEGRRLGINATPIFLVGPLGADNVVKIQRRISGAVGYEVFKAVIDGVPAGSREP